MNNAHMNVLLFGIIDHMHMLNTCVYIYICVCDSLNFELYINAYNMHSCSHAYLFNINIYVLVRI